MPHPGSDISRLHICVFSALLQTTLTVAPLSAEKIMPNPTQSPVPMLNGAWLALPVSPILSFELRKSCVRA